MAGTKPGHDGRGRYRERRREAADPTGKSDRTAMRNLGSAHSSSTVLIVEIACAKKLISQRFQSYSTCPDARKIFFLLSFFVKLLSPTRIPRSIEGRFAIVTSVERGMRWTLQREALMREDDSRRDGRPNRAVLASRC
jgi:hypothetical protein